MQKKMLLSAVIIVCLILGITTTVVPAVVLYDIDGEWNSSYEPEGEMAKYTIFQNNEKFFWQISHSKITEQVRNGRITNINLTIQYNRTSGPGATGGEWVKVKGTIVESKGDKATKIRWDNGVVWFRK